MTVENVIIIGSGPAGFTAGLYTSRAQLKPLLLTGNEIGGQVALTYEIENYPGFPDGLPGPELVEKLQTQAERFGTRIEYDYVTEVDLQQHPFVVRTQNGQEYRTKSVIVSTGATPRKLQIPGELELTGRGVSYCATCDGFFFRNKEVVVVGGGDSALEEGLFLTRFASKVTIVHRRDELRASKIMRKRALENEKIEFIWDTVLASINAGENGAVASVTLKNVKTEELRDLPAEGVFIFIGHKPNGELFSGQLAMQDGYIVTNRTMHTNIPGVFAAGEIQDNHFRQVATSVGQGTMAAMETERFLAELEDKRYEEIKAEMAGA
ncbi:MAG: thioredoxin-disulfide reductase [Chloroflexi bacterium]|nr:thioredoxin-disulfide reductase [Chloroflexota bacterium]